MDVVRALQLREVGLGGDRRQPRALAGDEPEVGAQSVRDQQDVGEEDRRVEAVAADRLERDLGGEVGVVAQRQEIARLRARRAVLRQVASGLTHHPDRRDGKRFAREGAQKQFVFHRLTLASCRTGGPTRRRMSIWHSCQAFLTRLNGRHDAELPTPEAPLRIGTRGSPLALAQAHETRRRLMAAFDLPEEAFEIVVIKTTGDQILDRPLKEIGGKGLFTREIEDDMLAGRIDIAVHSMKDMPVAQPDGLLLDCYLPREDVRDAFVSPHAGGLADLAPGTKVGTSSLRRKAQLLNRRPDLEVVEFRGNVQTRLRKLEDGVAACTFLAMAGLNRLGMTHVATSTIATEEMLPAVAQGAIGIERRADDSVRPKCWRRSTTARRADGLRRNARSSQPSTAPARRPSRVLPSLTAGRCGCGARSCAPTGPRRWPTTSAARSRTAPRWGARWRRRFWAGGRRVLRLALGAPQIAELWPSPAA